MNKDTLTHFSSGDLSVFFFLDILVSHTLESPEEQKNEEKKWSKEANANTLPVRKYAF